MTRPRRPSDLAGAAALAAALVLPAPLLAAPPSREDAAYPVVVRPAEGGRFVDALVVPSGAAVMKPACGEGQTPAAVPAVQRNEYETYGDTIHRHRIRAVAQDVGDRWLVAVEAADQRGREFRRLAPNEGAVSVVVHCAPPRR